MGEEINMYSVIDIETTGGEFNKERIIEIGIIITDGKKVLDALLWAVKFKGCSISGDEINEIVRIK